MMCFDLPRLADIDTCISRFQGCALLPTEDANEILFFRWVIGDLL